jgi:hypothetical protein
VTNKVRHWVSSTKNRKTACAIANPSKVAVPRPISSRTTRLLEVADLIISAVSFISYMKVDSLRSMLSKAPILTLEQKLRWLPGVDSVNKGEFYGIAWNIRADLSHDTE